MSTIVKKCVKCRQREVVHTTIPLTEVLEHDGQPYTIHLDNAKVLRCNHCGNTILEDDTIDELYYQLRIKADLLQPFQIKEIRTKYELTQKDFSRYLGVAESTLSRWETGAQIQQKSLNKLIKAFDVVPQLREYLSGGELSSSSTNMLVTH